VEIPLVDFNPWNFGDASDRRRVAADLDDAFASVGFAVLTGHGLDQDLVHAVRSTALEFFALDDSVKRRWQVGHLGAEGWVPMGVEANGYIFGEDTPPDLKETFAVGRGTGEHPDGWPALVALGRRHLEAATVVYESLLEACGIALGLSDPGILVEPCRDAPNSLSINWYPAVDRVGPPLPGQYRIGPHTDFGTLTLLDREPGLGCLQVQLEDGRWVDAPHVEGALIVNAADLLAMWSAGRWRSARHRVLPPSQDARAEELVSLVCFCEARPETMIAPLPGTDPAAAFEPVNAGEWLQAKMQQITVTT